MNKSSAKIAVVSDSNKAERCFFCSFGGIFRFSPRHSSGFSFQLRPCAASSRPFTGESPRCACLLQGLSGVEVHHVLAIAGFVESRDAVYGGIRLFVARLVVVRETAFAGFVLLLRKVRRGHGR